MDESARKTWSGLISPHPVSAAYPFWTWTHLQLSLPLAFGSDLFVGAPFRPDLVMRLGAIIDQHEITFMSSVPSMWKLALKTTKPPAVADPET